MLTLDQLEGLKVRDQFACDLMILLDVKTIQYCCFYSGSKMESVFKGNYETRSYIHCYINFQLPLLAYLKDACLELWRLQDPDIQCWGSEEDDDGDPPRLWTQTGMYPGTAFTRSFGDAGMNNV